MKLLWKMAFFFFGVLAVGVGLQFGRYFSASFLCLALVAGAGVSTFVIKLSATEKEVVFRGTAVNPATVALFAAVLVAFASYNLAALANMAVGSRSVQDATVVGVSSGRRCPHLASADLSSGANVTYCAAREVSAGERVRLKLVSSLLGVYAARG